MSSTTAKTFRLGLALPIACLGLAIGSAGSVYAQQASGPNGCASGTSYQAQKTQGLPPSVQDRAQRSDQEQLGGSAFQAQKTQGLPPSVQDRAQRADQEQLGGSSLQAQKTQGLPPSVQDRAQRAAADVNPPCG
jgi:hypothetical protein